MIRIMDRAIYLVIFTFFTNIVAVENVDSEVLHRYGEITKSGNDTRLYRGIQLKNRMKVLLVSDPSTEKSAGALSLDIGFHNDPDDIPGLAHFCEHMLFLGTKKYPEPTTYREFLLEKGGSNNGATDSTYTAFFFDVLSDHLESVLDMFAQFFISPLFNRNMIERELLAVNSEFDKNKKVDSRRVYQVIFSLLDKKHPSTKFGGGNKNTLQDIPKQKGVDVYQELLKFYEKWYSSNIMNLVLYGKESLDDLERMAIEYFSKIQDRNVTVPVLNPPFTKEYVGVRTYITPISDIKKLVVMFPIPAYLQEYKTYPAIYILELVGHEGTGSLLQFLKEKKWCTSLGGVISYVTKDSTLLTIDMQLTDTGLEHTDDIIEIIFQYINMLRNGGISSWIFDEIALMRKTNFRYKEKESPFKFASNYVKSLPKYAMEDQLSAFYLLTERKPELTEEILSMLKPENILVVVVAKKFENICNQTEKWYGTKYYTEKISEENIDRWNRSGLNSNLSLPGPNPFIPKTFDLYAPDPESKKFPTVILDDPVMRVWYKQDDEFFQPKLYSSFRFTSPVANLDPLSSNLNSLFVKILMNEINENTYATNLAGLNYHIDPKLDGIYMSINGYDSMQHVLLKLIMDKVKSLKINPDRFTVMKDSYVQKLRNYEAISPHEQISFRLSDVLRQINWSRKELVQAADAITIENLEDYIKQFLMKVHVECFFYGNIIKQKALDMASIVRNGLPKNMIPLLPHQMMPLREIEFDKGSHYRLEIDHKVHTSSFVLTYYQCGLQSVGSKAVMAFIWEIIRGPAFNILRTKEQLGYIVQSEVRENVGVHAMAILVQSDRHPRYVDSRIEALLQHIEEVIDNMSQESFEKYRQTIISKKLVPPNSLKFKDSDFYTEIFRKSYDFDSMNVEANALKNVTKKQVVDFFKENISVKSPNRRKLAIHIISSAKGGVADPSNLRNNTNETVPDDLLPVPEELIKPELIRNLLEFKNGRRLYPFPASYTNIPKSLSN